MECEQCKDTGTYQEKHDGGAADLFCDCSAGLKAQKQFDDGHPELSAPMGEKLSRGQVMAKARDKFIEDNQDLLNLTTLGDHPQYLQHRLENAFCAGYDQAPTLSTVQAEYITQIFKLCRPDASWGLVKMDIDNIIEILKQFI